MEKNIESKKAMMQSKHLMFEKTLALKQAKHEIEVKQFKIQEYNQVRSVLATLRSDLKKTRDKDLISDINRDIDIFQKKKDELVQQIT